MDRGRSSLRQNGQLSRAVRYALLSNAVVSGVAMAAPPAAETGAALQEVVVTGSRVVTPGLESISPLTTISAEELKFSGATRVEDLLNNLPQVFADQGGNLSNGSTGTAGVDLRNLGSQRTLVLINGRRLMPGDPTQNGASSPDLNQIPSALVQRVDVLTGGASAVYGADAVAGVVNFVMMATFEGLRVDPVIALTHCFTWFCILAAAACQHGPPSRSHTGSAWTPRLLRLRPSCTLVG